MKTPKPFAMLKEAYDLLDSITTLPDHVQKAMSFHNRNLQRSNLERQLRRISFTIKSLESENDEPKFE